MNMIFSIRHGLLHSRLPLLRLHLPSGKLLYAYQEDGMDGPSECRNLCKEEKHIGSGTEQPTVLDLAPACRPDFSRFSISSLSFDEDEVGTGKCKEPAVAGIYSQQGNSSRGALRATSAETPASLEHGLSVLPM